ncbi:MAG: glycosyltransferase, partial [Coriobacteriia bacterium]|nr:glycosyltransferase [Coriobacteriia bacterium]
ESRPDNVHCMNVDMLLAGYRAIGAGRFIYDSREHFATTGHYPWHVRRWWMLKERLLVPRAGGVLTVSEPIAEDLARRYRIGRPTVIYNGPVSVVDVATPAHEPLRVLHLGTLFTDRSVPDLVRAVAQLQDEVLLTIQGRGPEESTIRSLIDDLDARSVVDLVPPCAPVAITESARNRDVGVFIAPPKTQNLAWSAANKLFEYMGAGLAVLLPPGFPVMCGIVESAGCGVVFDPPTVTGLTECLKHLVDNPAEVERMKRNAVKAAAKYSWDSQAPALYEVYERALNRARAQ